MNKLTKDQLKALDLMEQGYNCFLTGFPGTGKSYLLNVFIEEMKKLNKDIIITASTGIAASHINGSTFHSVNKLGLAVGESVSDLVDKLEERWNSPVRDMWDECNILIIEEISMLDPEYWEKMSQVISYIRGDERPFGGIQVILCGDFLQLPPIKANKMIFETQVWKDLQLKMLLLTTAVRQKDEEFVNVLKELRFGKVSDEIFKYLQKRVISHNKKDILKLYPLRKDVDAENLKKLNEIKSPEVIYNAKIKYEPHSSKSSGEKYITKNIEDMEKNVVARKRLVLKEGCKVLYLKNDQNQGLFNGSSGTVLRFEGKYPIVKFKDLEVMVVAHKWEKNNSDGITTFTQLPLLCAYSITCHKSQGMSLDEAEIDLSKNIFENGQAYTAISRIKSISGVYISTLDKKSFKVDKKAVEFYERLISDI